MAGPAARPAALTLPTEELVNWRRSAAQADHGQGVEAETVVRPGAGVEAIGRVEAHFVLGQEVLEYEAVLRSRKAASFASRASRYRSQ